MSATPFTLIDGDRPGAPPASVEALIAGLAVELGPEAMETAFGWHLAPEGLCRAGLCVPLPRGMAAGPSGGLDLTELARALRAPARSRPRRARRLPGRVGGGTARRPRLPERS